MRPVALVEDDAMFARTLRASLEAEGFRVQHLGDAAAAQTLAHQPFSIALIDLEFRPAPALALCREASTLQPVIAFTGHSDVETRVAALENGAGDCLIRPFNLRELAVRMRNMLERASTQANYDDGRVLVDLEAMTVTIGGEEHALTHGENDILAILLAHAPAPVSVQDIATLLPAEARVQLGTIESRIKSLRRKLGGEHIVTRRGWGVQFV
ncbi:MAG TPA: response regulator transcription factor [Thermoanaerobaculia bacterium]|nr:response regulator transcription factor [Thermoanaerobaculia bacterium]